MWEEDEGEVCSRPSRKPKVASVVCLAFKFIMGWIKMCLSFNNSSFVWKMWSFNHRILGAGWDVLVTFNRLIKGFCMHDT